ncbi:MAG: alanine racemase [Flaviflexus sp.]|uniref:alanine racemase n=1 Tax=Flaviflexus sp. TaxID=1969482 RepID=UPI003F906AE8
MARVTLSRSKLRTNYKNLEDLLERKDVSWGAVSKLFCGDMSFIGEVLDLGIAEVHDSRIANLRAIKEQHPEVRTVYIKPAAHSAISDVVAWADVSFHSEMSTLEELNGEARRQGTTHEVVIMVEMGDLREGVLPEDLLGFYRQALQFQHIRVSGIGTNLNCLSGVLPSEEALDELVTLRDLLEKETGETLDLISAGTTVTLPLLESGDLPDGINHFRIGEALYFGQNLVEEKTFDGWHDDVLELHADVIELREKSMAPSGPMGTNPFGNVAEETDDRIAHRAIVDIGYLDVNPDFIVPSLPGIKIIDAASDMLVLDLGENPRDIAVGDTITFRLEYMGALHVMSSNYIGKEVVDTEAAGAGIAACDMEIAVAS